MRPIPQAYSSARAKTSAGIRLWTLKCGYQASKVTGLAVGVACLALQLNLIDHYQRTHQHPGRIELLAIQLLVKNHDVSIKVSVEVFTCEDFIA